MTINNLLDFEFFANNFLKIRSKSGSIEPLVLNRAQQYIHKRLQAQLEETGKVRAVILKGRQQGCSTYIGARFCHRVITNRGVKAFILTHEHEATTNLFDITKRYIENMPAGLCPKPDYSAANKLYFSSFDSGYAIGTAGNKAVGRSQTIQLCHASEAAFWPNAEEHSKGVMQAVSREPGTEIILESTANGIGNYYHKMWQSAHTDLSEYQAIFVPWYWQDEYKDAKPGFSPTSEEQELMSVYAKDGLTHDHLAWRRLKIAEFSSDYEQGREFFLQEYPMCSEDAFRSPVDNAFINSHAVMKARKTEVESDSVLIIGVDPAISDKDKTAIIRRRGRKVYGLETWRNHNTMQTAGRLRKIIEEDKPAKVFIDCIGIGAGIVDRLREQGLTCVEGINVANRASQSSKFKNKRAELWSEMRDWLTGEMPVELPDSDELHSALCCLSYKYDSSGRLQIESKDDVRGRGFPSPDEADSLALTYSEGAFLTVSDVNITNRHILNDNRSWKFY